MSHEARATTEGNWGGQSASIASCSCGWRGPRAFHTRAEAQEAADQHVADEIGAALELMADAMAIPSERDEVA